jgi:hypothetical protein
LVFYTFVWEGFKKKEGTRDQFQTITNQSKSQKRGELEGKKPVERTRRINPVMFGVCYQTLGNDDDGQRQWYG